MFPTLFETVTDLQQGADLLRRRRYGTIDVRNGKLERIVLRPLPKFVSLPQVWLHRLWVHRGLPADRCLVYYDQPLGHRDYLALKYALSYRGASLATCQEAARILDQIAQLKGSDAILCDVSNARISDRFLQRQGWQPHCPSRWHRHYIKRRYQPPSGAWSVVG